MNDERSFVIIGAGLAGVGLAGVGLAAVAHSPSLPLLVLALLLCFLPSCP